MILHCTLFFVRRLLFVVCVFGMDDFLCTQIVVLMAISIAMVAYLHNGRPHESPFSRRLETTNECIVLTLLTFLMCLSASFPEDSRIEAGKVYVGIGLTHLTLYMSMILILNLITYRKKVKRKCFLCSLKKMTAQQIYVLKNKNKVASQKKKERDQKKAKKPIADYVSRRQGLAIVPEQSEVSSVKEVSLSKLEISEVELSGEQSSAPDKSIVEVPTVVPEV